MADEQQEPQKPKPKHEPIDWLDPLIIAAFVTAFICDLLFFLIIPHYFGALIAIPIMWSKTRKWPAKSVLIAAFVLPLPVLTLGICLAIFLSNKAIAFVAEQVGIQIVAVFTAGAGEALEGAALAGEAVEGAAAAAEAASAAGQVGEVAGALAETGEAAGGVAKAGEGARAATEGVEAGEEAGEAAEEGAEESLKEKIKRKAKEKIKEKLESGQGGEEEEEEEKSEEEAAEEARMFGMPETPEQELEGQLFPEETPMSSVKSISEAPKKAQLPRPPRNGNPVDNVTSIDEFKKVNQKLKEANQKAEELQKQWESARNEDIDKAA